MNKISYQPVNEKSSKSAVSLKSTGLNQDIIIKKQTIALYISQCYSVLDTMGKGMDDMENLIRVMHESLKSYGISEIQDAFGYWIRKKTMIPKPAEIENVIFEKRKARRAASPHKLRSFSEFDGNWEDYGVHVKNYERLFLEEES